MTICNYYLVKYSLPQDKEKLLLENKNVDDNRVYVRKSEKRYIEVHSSKRTASDYEEGLYLAIDYRISNCDQLVDYILEGIKDKFTKGDIFNFSFEEVKVS